jgi:PKD repeat protein
VVVSIFVQATTHMKQSRLHSFVILAALAVGVSGCTMKDQERPPLAGPSEFAQSLFVSVSPDVLPQDGASQSLVTATVRDANAQPMRNVTLRAEIRVGGVPVDFGALSARSVVTGNDGRAMVVYTAPSAPSVTADPFVLVDVVLTPVGTDFTNSNSRGATIRLVPPGGVIPPINMIPDFVMTPATPADNQTVLFDATGSVGNIAEFRWNFGDGGTATGAIVSHAYASAGTYIVTLTVVDPFGQTVSTARSILVTGAAAPTASFVFSPTNPRVGQNINFNASASRAPAGNRIVSYTWDFGDGTPRVTTPDTVVGKSYAAAATYTVTLLVTDQAGRIATVSLTIQVAP